jgi:deoxyhypusine monooxygenase
MTEAKAADQVDHFGHLLSDPGQPLKNRFRALFALRNLGGQTAVDWISKNFSDTSALLKHELAYCLGQMQDKHALETLTRVLSEENEDPMVRHEAGEALGAIGDVESLAVLEKFSNCSSQEVAETCRLAVQRIKYLHDNTKKGEKLSDNPYKSVDPSPPHPIAESSSAGNQPPAPIHASPTVLQLCEELINETGASLWDRYRAMFSLRNMGSDAAIKALCEGLSCPGSALFRHEIAYVLGQVQSPLGIVALAERLADPAEHYMVRHEAAEALGSIATPECIALLEEHLEDEDRVVRESVEVALDMTDYEADAKAFDFSDRIIAGNVS